jgi:hypothetical protein
MPAQINKIVGVGAHDCARVKNLIRYHYVGRIIWIL